MARECHPMLEGMDAEFRASFLQEMHDEYMNTAAKADAKADAFERDGDKRKAKEYRADAKHWRVMAERALDGYLDEPETHVSMYSYDDAIGGADTMEEVEFDKPTEATEQTTDASDFEGANSSGRSPEEVRVMELARAGGMANLTPKQGEVAEVYMGARVSREDAPELLGIRATMTFDTHVRDVNKRWGDLRAVTERAF